MAINAQHPSFDAYEDDWLLMRHSYGGERIVKLQKTRYLPATKGQILDGQGQNKPNSVGEKDYDAYRARAVFPDYVREAVEHYVGMMHRKPAQFELPKVMEPLLLKATNAGETLQTLLRRINSEQLTTGRLGLLLDMPPPESIDPANPLPYIAVYIAESMINWDDSNNYEGVNSLGLVVLDESGPVRMNDFTWKDEERFRVLMLLPVAEKDARAETPDAVVTIEPGQPAIYKQKVFIGVGAQVTVEEMVPPTLRGKPLEMIPFIFINTKDIVTSPDLPPLLGLARMCMTIYRGEADYRQTLYLQGQDTLVTIGGIVDTSGTGGLADATDEAVRTGAGSRIDLNIGGDAKYIGVSANGLPEQRTALENDRKQAETKSGQMIAPSAGKQESGDAMSTRMSAQTATLNQIAKTGATALENLLKVAAVWLGANPEEVKVTPNLEFVHQPMPTKDLVDLMSARTMGAPLSIESIHEILVARGYTRKDLEDELAAIAEEDIAAAQRAAKVMALLPTPAPASGPGSAPSPAPASK
jgi:Domain of unknown function (DUF4055)